jgi:hypothetical protein
MVAPPLCPPGESGERERPYAVAATSGAPEMPKALRDELGGLESWATVNNEAAQSDSKMFWILKGPAILRSAFGVLLSYYRYADGAMLVGTLGGILVLLDGIMRPGIMRNARYLAYFESRELQSSIVAKRKAAVLKDPAATNKVAAELIEELNKERARISAALKLVEVNQATS